MTTGISLDNWETLTERELLDAFMKLPVPEHPFGKGASPMDRLEWISFERGRETMAKDITKILLKLRRQKKRQ